MTGEDQESHLEVVRRPECGEHQGQVPADGRSRLSGNYRSSGESREEQQSSVSMMFIFQFNCEGTTMSGVEFELVGLGYRVSLVKRRFVSGNASHSHSSPFHIQ